MRHAKILGAIAIVAVSACRPATDDPYRPSDTLAEDETTGADVGTDVSTTTGSEPDESGDAKELCARLVECYRATALPGVVALIEAYGEEGACWTTAGVTARDCAAECAALLEAAALVYPDEIACDECMSDDDCAWSPERIYCNEELGTCSASDCGNGSVDEGEACDADVGCLPDCTWAPGCGEASKLDGESCIEDCDCGSGFCIVDDGETFGLCNACRTAADCPSGDVCWPPHCFEAFCEVGGCGPMDLPTDESGGPDDTDSGQNDDCSSCGIGACVEQAEACVADEDCECLVACTTSDCTITDECYARCGVASNVAADALVECLVGGCGQICGC